MNHLYKHNSAPRQKTSRFLVFPILITFLMVYFSPSLLAQDSEKEERWFEFEVILFKLRSEDGLFAESWKDDSQLKLSEGVVDFLQPYEVLELIENIENPEFEDNSSNKSTEDVKSPVSSSSSIPSQPDINEELVEFDNQEDLGEQPFIRLADELLQLTSESKSIKRQSRYQLIEHFLWRQPVDSRANATKIRIAGGFDYSENFEYSGDKKIEFVPIVEDLLSDNEMLNTDLDIPEQQISDFSEKTLQQTISENADEQSENLLNDDPTTQESLILAKPKPFDWVPEIDGEIKVYIHRNYLHVDTNLVYRKPQEITVDIFHLDEQPFGYTFSNKNPLATNLLEEQSINNPTIGNGSSSNSSSSNSTDNSNPFSVPSTNFNWEFDSDFLNKKAEKLFTQKLFNYPLIQERRVRSGELHYFDHPLIGMLIIIRPYETEVFEDELIDPE